MNFAPLKKAVSLWQSIRTRVFNDQQSEAKRGKLTFEGPRHVKTTVVAPFVINLAVFTSACRLRNVVVIGPIIVPTAA